MSGLSGGGGCWVGSDDPTFSTSYEELKIPNLVCIECFKDNGEEESEAGVPSVRYTRDV